MLNEKPKSSSLPNKEPVDKVSHINKIIKLITDLVITPETLLEIKLTNGSIKSGRYRNHSISNPFLGLLTTKAILNFELPNNVLVDINFLEISELKKINSD
ncbi:hypothetical protein [Leptospira neocaledonica]|uniref:Uncharacterized protein n=1 Tax=Leptospira neocaledonica TaxID=2023192 RepID=A0A2M9ZVX9_9LEPT|nr:hypothetical protein [Leptospira neocaledonica]PJZ76226.1 hypothetical protein CH365_15510 [Leptospira neocaledonica]